MFTQMLRNFENKTIQLYPGDSNAKFGKVLDANSGGVTFLITKSNCDRYAEGDVYFISYSANLKFKIVE